MHPPWLPNARHTPLRKKKKRRKEEDEKKTPLTPSKLLHRKAKPTKYFVPDTHHNLRSRLFMSSCCCFQFFVLFFFCHDSRSRRGSCGLSFLIGRTFFLFFSCLFAFLAPPFRYSNRYHGWQPKDLRAPVFMLPFQFPHVRPYMPIRFLGTFLQRFCSY